MLRGAPASPSSEHRIRLATSREHARADKILGQRLQCLMLILNHRRVVIVCSDEEAAKQEAQAIKELAALLGLGELIEGEEE